MGLDEKKTRHARLALDAHSSLISIETPGEAAHALPLVARQIRQQIPFVDNVLLLERACALLLPATPFSGAQAVANRVSQLLIGVPCTLNVYHGTTALLVLQRLYTAGAEAITRGECAVTPPAVMPAETRHNRAKKKDTAPDSLPYLAFLTNYPSPRLLHLLPYELACRYQCIPVGVERNMLTLGTCHWLNREIVAQLHAITHRGIFQVRCEVTMIDEVLRYWQQSQQAVDNDHCELKMDEVRNGSR